MELLKNKFAYISINILFIIMYMFDDFFDIAFWNSRQKFLGDTGARHFKNLVHRRGYQIVSTFFAIWSFHRRFHLLIGKKLNGR